MNPPLTPVQRFWKLLRPDKKEIRNVYVYSIFNGLIYLTLPLGIQAILNLIQGGQVSTSWIVLVCIVVLGVAATGVLQILQLRITENLQQKIFTRAAFEFTYRIPKIKMEALYEHYAPELMNRFFDIISVQKGLSKMLIDFTSASLSVFFGLMLLSIYHPFFIIFSVVLVVLIYIIFKLTAKQGLETSLQESKFKYKVAYWLEELARASNTFKLAGNNILALKRTNENVEDYLTAREDHFQVLVRQYWLMISFKVIVAAGLLALGGMLVMQQKMDIGQFVAAEIIILMVMSSVEKIILSMATIYDVLTSLEKIGQVTDLELESTEGTSLAKVCEGEGMKIDLKDVSFTYPDLKNPTLNNINWEISEGERILLTGENNSGKSTLLHLIAGLYEVQSGSLVYQGFPVKSLSTASLRETMGYLYTQEQLFEGTLLENITMDRPDLTIKDVQAISAKLFIQPYIEQLPEGFNTRIFPEGKQLSKSLAQKILLARNIITKPKLLLLKGALDYVEDNERDNIFDYLTDKEQGWTFIAISSYPYLKKKVDKIVTMKNGSINSITEKNNR